MCSGQVTFSGSEFPRLYNGIHGTHPLGRDEDERRGCGAVCDTSYALSYFSHGTATSVSPLLISRGGRGIDLFSTLWLDNDGLYVRDIK